MKQKVLLCWNYERQSWVDHFERTFEPGEYIFLNFFSRTQEVQNHSKVPVFYWEDFEDIDAVIVCLEPTKVVFMGLEGPYNLLLNYVCKKKKIPTYFLQHGIFHSYKAYRYEEKSMRQINAGDKKINAPDLPIKNKGSWLLRSFTLNRLPVYLKIAAFLAFKKLFHSTQLALKMIAGESAQADHYIVYTRYLSGVLQERDKVPDRKMIEVGNPEANEIIARVDAQPLLAVEPYFLLIDEAFAGSKEQKLSPIVPISDWNRFLVTLAEYAQSQNARLKVKLHPFSYNEDHFVVHTNIDYVKQANMVELIAACTGVFGFSSTLLIPAMYSRPSCIFKLNDFSDLHRAIKDMQYCPVLDFHHFTSAQINFKPIDPTLKQEFVNYFLFQRDTEYINRLQKILHTNFIGK